MIIRTTAFAVAVGMSVVFAAPARAEAISLVCSVGQETWIVDIDLDNGLVTDRPSWLPAEQVKTEHAEISPSTIRWRCNRIDRQTGDIFLCEGHGTCKRANKPLL